MAQSSWLKAKARVAAMILRGGRCHFLQLFRKIVGVAEQREDHRPPVHEGLIEPACDWQMIGGTRFLKCKVKACPRCDPVVDPVVPPLSRRCPAPVVPPLSPTGHPRFVQSASLRFLETLYSFMVS